MSNHSIENIRSTINDFPKIWEWSAIFTGLDTAVTNLISGETLTVLMETNSIPDVEMNEISANYKGASISYATRLKLNGEITLNFKEIKGTDANSSWLVRRAIKKWMMLEDNFFGTIKNSPKTRITMTLTLEDEAGTKNKKIKYFGLIPEELASTALNYKVADGYPTCSVKFLYDYFRFEGQDGYNAV